MADLLDKKLKEHVADVMTDYSKAKDKLFILLRGIPYKYSIFRIAFCDLYETIGVRITENVTAYATRNCLELWGVDEEELFEIALSNTKKKLPATFEKIDEILKRFGHDTREDFREFPMYVISNEEAWNGAAAILYCNDLPNQFYMLPSSIHEVILVEAPKNTVSSWYFNKMVREVNKSEVDVRERLSVHAYYYDNGRWEICENEEVKASYRIDFEGGTE